ncbi:MAG: rhomboid family intramembrane serine protease [Chitinispirillaceae bacterium]
MIPLKCESHPNNLPLVTILLMTGAVVTFGYQLQTPDALRGFVPLDFVHALFHPGEQTFETLKLCCVSLFLHGGLFHLASNMWYLWIFGNAVEYKMHGVLFLVCYVVAGAVSMIVQALSDPYSSVPVVGASGAIAGIMGMHLVLLPFARIIVWVPPIFVLPVPAFIFLIAWFIMQYLGAGSRSEMYIAWWAHIGGFITGILLALRLRRKKALFK